MPRIVAGALDVDYLESGPTDGPVAILLHGFPYSVHCYDPVTPRLAERGVRSIVPHMRGYGGTRFVDPDRMRSGEQAAFGADLLALMDALEIERAVVGGFDWGGRGASIVAMLHPERVTGLVSGGVAYNLQNIARCDEPGSPYTEHTHWYQFLFHLPRGERMLEEKRAELVRYIWQLWSPGWRFTEDAFQAALACLDNPDFVAVVLHSYRHRYALVPSDPDYAPIEKKLSRQPEVTVPTRVLLGGESTIYPVPENDPTRAKFTADYKRTILPGVGHNIPQEAPEAFAEAVLDLIGR